MPSYLTERAALTYHAMIGHLWRSDRPVDIDTFETSVAIATREAYMPEVVEHQVLFLRLLAAQISRSPEDTSTEEHVSRAHADYDWVSPMFTT